MARKQKLPTCCTRTRSQSVLHMARAMEAFGQIWQHTLGQLCMQMLLCTTAHHLVVGGVGGVEGGGSTVGRLLRAMCHISIHICICTSRSVAGDFGSNVSIALRCTCLRVRTSAHQITNGAHMYVCYVCVCIQRGAATILPNSGGVQYTGPSITLCAVLLVPRITNSAGASYGSRKMLALLVNFLDRQPSLHPLWCVCSHCQHLLHS